MSGPGHDADELPRLSDLVLGLADIGDDAVGSAGAASDEGVVSDVGVGGDAGNVGGLDRVAVGELLLESLVVDLPVELGIRAASGGAVRLHASTPTQRIETTILPVWHRLRLRLEASDEETG